MSAPLRRRVRPLVDVYVVILVLVLVLSLALLPKGQLEAYTSTMQALACFAVALRGLVLALRLVPHSCNGSADRSAPRVA